MAEKQRDPLTAGRFSLVIDGVEIAAFNELGGMDSEVTSVPYQASSDKEVIYQQLPGQLKWPTLTLKRGMTGGRELAMWHEAVRSGDMVLARKSGSIVMYSPKGDPIAKFWIENAWPSKLTISALKAGSSDILYEQVTITCESWQRIEVG
jgi:phage tail-like protein